LACAGGRSVNRVTKLSGQKQRTVTIYPFQAYRSPDVDSDCRTAPLSPGLQQRGVPFEIVRGLQPAFTYPRSGGALGVFAVPGGKLAKLLRILWNNMRHHFGT